MRKVKQIIPPSKKVTEEKRLELIEKKVEIQKKRLEIKKEKLSIDKMIFEMTKGQIDIDDKKVNIRSKRLENKRAILDMEELLKKRTLESEQMLNDKIFIILFTLMISVIDEERTILGSEPFYTNLLKGGRREMVENKLMDLIKRI